MTYNGWKNWETWNLYNWLTCSEDAYRYAAGFDADELRDVVTEEAPLDVASWYTDVILAALGAVDWQELAEALAE